MPGGGGGGQTVNTSQFSSSNFNNTTDMGPWKTQIPYLGQTFGEAARLYTKGAPQYFPGSSVSPFDPTQITAMHGINNAAKAAQPNFGRANDLYSSTISGNFLDPSSNPWLSKTFAAGADDVTRAYRTATSPTTGANFSMLGRYGAPAYRLAKEGNELALGKTLDNLATNIYGGNYQTERGRQMDAVSGLPALAAGSLIGPQAMLGVGNMIRDQSQAMLSDDVNRWNYNQNQEWQNLARYKSLIDGNYGQSGTQSGSQTGQSYGTQTQAGGGGNPFMQGLGGLLSLGSLAGQLGWAPFASGAAGAAGAAGGMGSLASAMGPLIALSDVHAKRDIKPVGKTFGGQNLYAYRYKGDAEPRIGLMAQEVELLRPDAVITHPSGLKMVDYGRALGWEAFG